MWRATCNFPKYKTDIHRDYVRAQINEVDILRFEGFGQCHKVDYINIRGHVGINVTVAFWQYGRIPSHADSSGSVCEFDVGRSSDDYAGSSGIALANNAFRCTEVDESTTQYWYGADV